jgi:arylsulfatase A-like enzyme
MPGFSRRDFLKVGSVLSGAVAASRVAAQIPTVHAALPNFLIIVLDALSAKNMSLHGYARQTTPNLERFAQRATVYNQHYSTGNFTTPGTASLLTGLYPWTHRALNKWGPIAHAVAGNNIFRAVGRRYYRLAYSQNTFPNFFFGQFQGDLEKILSAGAFSIDDQVVAARFGRDTADSHRAFDDFLFQDHFPPASLVFGLAADVQLYEAVAHSQAQDYPDGLPRTKNYPIFFKLRDVFDGLMGTIDALPSPSLAYLHLWAPHAPYQPTKDFGHIFNDGWSAPEKPQNVLDHPFPPRYLARQRLHYDRYIANVDFEFGRLLDFLEAKGILDTSYVIITSDHGEMFERGVEAHDTPLLYDPVVRIPLLVSAPGQTARQDITIPTSSVDVLPTVVHLSGGEVPAWCEGQVLPGFGGPGDAERSVFIVEAKDNRAFRRLTRASFALRKGRNKLTYYAGYPENGEEEAFELYDVEQDPEELSNLYNPDVAIARLLRDELLAKVQAENARFKA